MCIRDSQYRANDETREETTFVDCEAWGRTAAVMGQYLRKGRPVFIEGRLKLDQWEDKNTGQRRSKLGVILEKFTFVGGGGGQAGGGGGAPQSPAPAPTSDVPPFEDGPSDDDVPF